MKRKTVWTIELPSEATCTDAIFAMAQKLGGKVVKVQERTPDFTDEECQFWYTRWLRLPSPDPLSSGNTVVAFCFKNGELKIGKAKCCPGDAYNYNFGRALAAARLYGDRKLERALLHFTPEQIKKYFK